MQRSKILNLCLVGVLSAYLGGCQKKGNAQGDSDTNTAADTGAAPSSDTYGDSDTGTDSDSITAAHGDSDTDTDGDSDTGSVPLTGPHILKDIAENPNPSDFTQAGETLFFTAETPLMSRELWKSDLSEAGTALVKEIATEIEPGFESGTFSDLTPVGNRLFFFVNHGIGSLWVSDGTEEGTTRVKSIAPAAHDDIVYPRAAGDKLFFCGDDEMLGRGLWVSDGTEAGTALLYEIPETDDYPTPISVLDGALFFMGARNAIWRSDGTLAGTVQIGLVDGDVDMATSPAGGFYTLNGDVYFMVVSDGDGDELWKLTGRTSEVSNVKFLNPPPHPFRKFSFASFGDTLFVYTGDQLWASDGTKAGTALLVEIENRDTNGAIFTSDSNIYFAAEEELWTSDGTLAGTIPVASITPHRFLADLGDRVLFIGTTEGDATMMLWRSDGTGVGTYEISSVASSGDGGFLQEMVRIGDVFYYTADDGIHGEELWQTDGTAEGTMIVKDIMLGPASSHPDNLFDMNGTLVFTASDELHHLKLWVLPQL